MDLFDKKTHKTPRGYTYTYYISQPTPHTDTTLPTLLFQHGWPDHAAMWSGVARSLLQDHSTPYQILIPDMLGYDGTSKPTSASAYKQDGLTTDMISLLDALSITNVISIGHDWGSRLASRLYNYHPTRVSGLVNLNVPYAPPQRETFDLATVNAGTEHAVGYPIFAYWEVFAAPDGPQLLASNVPRLFAALHAQGADAMKRYFCVPGAMRAYLSSTDADDEPEVRQYARDPEFKRAFVERMQRDGFEGPQNWYVATATNLQMECDGRLPVENDKVDVPALYIGATEDAVCRPEWMEPARQAGLLPDLEMGGMIEASHWVTYEKPAEVAEVMARWLKKKF